MNANLCERCESPLEIGDLRCAICGNAAPADTRPVAEVAVKIHRCAGCGAGIT